MFSSSEHILVTGGAGFIGSAVVRELFRNTDARIINVDKLTYAGDLASVAEVSASNRYVFERADVCDGRALERVFRTHQPTAVLHLAAESHVDRSINGAAEFIRTNVVGTQTLLDVARSYWSELDGDRKRDFRFHHVSTDEVYGSLDDFGVFTEDSAYRPNSPYAASKASSDHLVRAWHHTYGLPAIITNCSNNYGPYQFPEKLIPLMICQALDGKPLPVYGSGKNVRDWLYVEDHASALIAILKRGRPGETYNIGGSAETANIDLVKRLCSVLDRLHPDERSLSSLDHVRSGPARPRLSIRDRLLETHSGAGLAPARDAGSGHREDGPMVSGASPLDRPHPLPQLRRAAPRAGRVEGVVRREPKILVTGAAGQVGSALVRLSATQPFPLIALRREQLDLSDPAQIQAVCDDLDPAIVVNAAAYTAVDKAEEQSELAFAANSEGPGWLAEWCCKRQRPLVHISSDYVFSGSSTTPFKEDDPIAPLNVYGRSKALGERNIRESDAPYVIIRTAWVYAAGGKNFVRTMLELGRERDEVRVVNDQWGSPTYADDIVRAIHVIIRRLLSDAPVYGTFHYAGSGETTWYHFADFIFDHAERHGQRRPKLTPISTGDFPTPARRPAYSVLDTSLYRSTFGEAPAPWQDSAARALEMIFHKGS